MTSDLRTHYRNYLRDLEDEIAAARNVTVPDLWGKSRRAPTVAARHEFWERGRALLGLSAAAFAELVGINHSAILYAIAKRRAARRETTSKAWGAKAERRRIR